MSKRVVMAMQETPPIGQTETVIVERTPRPVIVEEYYYGRPGMGRRSTTAPIPAIIARASVGASPSGTSRAPCRKPVN